MLTRGAEAGWLFSQVSRSPCPAVAKLRPRAVSQPLPFMRLRYGGSAARWGSAMYPASKDGYEDAVLPTGAFAGLPEDALDCAAGLYLADPTG